MRLRPTTFAITALLAASLTAAACASHDPKPVFRSTVFIGDRGISVPLPPPSLIDQPKQSVDVDGEIQGDRPDGMTQLHIVDAEGDAELTIALESGATSFNATALSIDLTANCLEVWLEDEDGQETEPALFHAEISEDGETIVTTPGCE